MDIHTEASDNSYFQFQYNWVIRSFKVRPRVPQIIYLQYTTKVRDQPTGIISLTLDSMRRLVVLALHVLLSNKKSLEIAHMPNMELRIRNWTGSYGSRRRTFQFLFLISSANLGVFKNSIQLMRSNSHS